MRRVILQELWQKEISLGPKPFGVFIEILRRKPNKNPDTVVKRALSLIMEL